MISYDKHVLQVVSDHESEGLRGKHGSLVQSEIIASSIQMYFHNKNFTEEILLGTSLVPIWGKALIFLVFNQ